MGQHLAARILKRVERAKGFEPSPPSRAETTLCHKLGPHSLWKRPKLRFPSIAPVEFKSKKQEFRFFAGGRGPIAGVSHPDSKGFPRGKDAVAKAATHGTVRGAGGLHDRGRNVCPVGPTKNFQNLPPCGQNFRCRKLSNGCTARAGLYAARQSGCAWMACGRTILPRMSRR